MKKIFITFLTFVLYFNSLSLVHASTVGGWSLGNPIAQGASTLYNGAKNVLINGKNVAKTSTALITPVATDVAKVLARGGAAYALSVAVEQLIGAGVDWVLDPANNQIKYTVPNPNNSNLLWIVEGLDYTVASTQYQACMIAVSRNPTVASDSGTWGSFQSVSNNKCVFKYRSIDLVSLPNPAYDPSKDEEKTLPLDVVANQVISNAESGDTDAQVATTAAAADIVNDAQNDSTKARPIVNQLEANAETKTEEEATGQSKPNTETGATDLSLTFPVFCGWAPVVCEAAQTVISFPQTLTNWWETANDKAQNWAKSISDSWVTAKEWATTEKDKNQDDTEIEILDDAVPNLDKGLFQASGQCPPDFSYAFPLPLGGSYNITYSYSTACNWFSKIYYVVILVASIIGLKIVTGADGNKDG